MLCFRIALLYKAIRIKRNKGTQAILNLPVPLWPLMGMLLFWGRRGEGEGSIILQFPDDSDWTKRGGREVSSPVCPTWESHRHPRPTPGLQASDTAAQLGPPQFPQMPSELGYPLTQRCPVSWDTPLIHRCPVSWDPPSTPPRRPVS